MTIPAILGNCMCSRSPHPYPSHTRGKHRVGHPVRVQPVLRITIHGGVSSRPDSYYEISPNSSQATAEQTEGFLYKLQTRQCHFQVSKSIIKPSSIPIYQTGILHQDKQQTSEEWYSKTAKELGMIMGGPGTEMPSSLSEVMDLLQTALANLQWNCRRHESELNETLPPRLDLCKEACYECVAMNIILPLN